MAEWLLEDGIGEERAILIEQDEIVAARLRWPGALEAGEIADAVLIARTAGAPRGTARFPNGEEALVDRLPASAAEGSVLRLEVLRPAMAERGRMKRAQARPSEQAPRPAPSLLQSLRAEGHEARPVHRFPVSVWDELVAEAFAAQVDFAGGALLFSPTPAMLLVDVDGTGSAQALALAAIPSLAAALRRFDVGGAIGVDFPTLASKADRRAVDEALEAALAGWPHERTAMNGFGFVQIVARLRRPSLLQRAHLRRSEMAARLLLRRAEGLQGAGAVELTGHPALAAAIRPEWRAELARRTGRELRWRADPGLAIEAPHAQLVPL
ncbi:ribonuclease [Altererythrobacter sp. B11]|uniref:ribonuclease n=1 Tax=Altererythrobacter sp. B11 TaxID=2060312 RepID=UPI000DC70FD4|nr:ribonuclease [Altererythrobacter sp. B11]BBC73799.1 ribonuclease [Altererythrobacter sp. B11]